ncbi:nephrin-like [Mytilus galloprovincialis]|uniref:nephrin-like n=1 Tax=Mytilus galloprovincialis TaxID=29158 RepID=UPI003F7BBFFE
MQTPQGVIDENEQITLTCEILGGNPLANIVWQCDGASLVTPTGVPPTNKSVSSVQLTAAESHNGKVCTCTGSHPAWTQTKSSSITLLIRYAPNSHPAVMQVPSGPVNAGSKVTLTCYISGGNPLPTIAWQCTDFTNVIPTTTQPTDKVVSIIERIVTKVDNGKECLCTSHHPLWIQEKLVKHRMNIYYAPHLYPTIQQMPAGSILTGSKISLICAVSGGNPLSTLSLNCTGTSINNTSGDTAAYSVTFIVDKTFNSKICTCSATHPISSYRPNVYHTLVVYYAPETNPSIQQTPSGSIITGTEIVLTCSASGGNPLATLTWNCSGAKIKNTTEYIASYSVTFIVDKTFNNKICTCSAIHPIVSYRPRVQRTLVVYFKPFLDTTRSNSPEETTTSENDYLFITVWIKSNPHPIIQWTFLAQENIDFCNNSVLNSTSMNVGLYSSSNISIEYLKKNQFGQYIFIATNVVGIFRRKFSVLEKVSFGEDMLTTKEGISSMFSAGIASLVVGLLFFVSAIVVILRKRFRKTYTKSSKCDEYSDLQTSNPAFQDPYTSLQNTIESRQHQESSANTYEECGNASDAAAYQNIENLKSGNKLNIYV